MHFSIGLSGVWTGGKEYCTPRNEIFIATVVFPQGFLSLGQFYQIWQNCRSDCAFINLSWKLAQYYIKKNNFLSIFIKSLANLWSARPILQHTSVEGTLIPSRIAIFVPCLSGCCLAVANSCRIISEGKVYMKTNDIELYVSRYDFKLKWHPCDQHFCVCMLPTHLFLVKIGICLPFISKL